VKLSILAVSHKPPAWATEACDDYLQRFGQDLRVAVQDLKPAVRGASGSASKWMQQEALLINQALPVKRHLVVLDEHGEDMTSTQLSARLARWRELGHEVCIVIGGPDGLDPSIKQQANEKLRLSSLTLPHALVKVLLLEQLFRALSILNNHPYHRT
jgi:23S rRNA (pseudouridine1915-N3)-methyltransferase